MSEIDHDFGYVRTFAGFDSIEVDVFVIDNAVLVGHNLGDLHSHNSLQVCHGLLLLHQICSCLEVS